MKQDTSDYISYLIYDKKIFRIIKNAIITIIVLILIKNVLCYMYNKIHYWQKYYPSDYVETILRQNKKHYQRVADYATSSDIEKNYDGDALINSDGYTIGLFDSSLEFDDIRVKWSRDIIQKRQHLWGINGKKNANGVKCASFEFCPSGFEPDGSSYRLNYYPDKTQDIFGSVLNKDRIPLGDDWYFNDAGDGYYYKDLGDGWYYRDMFVKK